MLVMDVSDRKNRLSPLPVRSASIVVFAFVSLVSIWVAVSAGLASVLSSYAVATNQLSSADLAVTLSPKNADAHLWRAALLEANGDLPSAVSEYQRAATLRPQDYVLWLALARASEMAGDAPQAIAAGHEAVNLAPYYAEPHWQLGNILVRAGELDEGFRELSIAANSNGTLMPGVIDLAWHLFGGDAKAVERAMQPHTPESYRALAAYFRQHDAVDDAIAMFDAAGDYAQADIRDYISELVAKKKFAQAYSLWRRRHDVAAPENLNDPGFEQESDLTEPGFGWLSAEPPPATCRFTLDAVNPKEGKFSLRLDFTGDFDPSTPVISQLTLVQPLAHYQLRFAARSENLLSAGLPIVAIVDPNTRIAIAKTEQVPRSAEQWRDYAIDFTTGPATTAIQVAVEREGCTAPCPIFGRVWLDGFSLRKL